MKTGISNFLALTIFLILSIAGCSTGTKFGKTTFSDRQLQQKAEYKLAESADSISKSLAELAAIERNIHPQKVIPSPLDPKLVGMDQLISIDWNGTIEPLVKKLAAISKYRFKTLGNPPGVPILISISAKDTPLADILRDANFQCGNKAKIVIYPATKIIELRYVK